MAARVAFLAFAFLRFLRFGVFLHTVFPCTFAFWKPFLHTSAFFAGGGGGVGRRDDVPGAREHGGCRERLDRRFARGRLARFDAPADRTFNGSAAADRPATGKTPADMRVIQAQRVIGIGRHEALRRDEEHVLPSALASRKTTDRGSCRSRSDAVPRPSTRTRSRGHSHRLATICSTSRRTPGRYRSRTRGRSSAWIELFLCVGVRSADLLRACARRSAELLRDHTTHTTSSPFRGVIQEDLMIPFPHHRPLRCHNRSVSQRVERHKPPIGRHPRRHAINRPFAVDVPAPKGKYDSQSHESPSLAPSWESSPNASSVAMNVNAPSCHRYRFGCPASAASPCVFFCFTPTGHRRRNTRRSRRWRCRSTPARPPVQHRQARCPSASPAAPVSGLTSYS